jgi:hypothetical protein
MAVEEERREILGRIDLKSTTRPTQGSESAAKCFWRRGSR